MSRSALENNQTDSVNRDWAQPIIKENLSDRAYFGLRQALMRGQLKPGEMLRLRPMSSRFGISATPMREALLRLVGEKALTLDSRGTVVVPTLTLAQLMEIREIRMDLEGRAAAAAATASTTDEVETLEGIHARITECHASKAFEKAIDLNTEFHLTLCRMGRLPIVYDIVETLWIRCGPILSHLYDAGLPDWEPHPHSRIIAALNSKDKAAARAAICEDIEHGGKGLLMHASDG